MDERPPDPNAAPSQVAAAARTLTRFASFRALPGRLIARARYTLAHPRAVLRWALLLTVVCVGTWMISWRAFGWYHLSTGKGCLERSHCREALEHFQAALTVWPNDAHVLFLAARGARRAGELDLADRCLTRCAAAPGLAESVALETALLRATRGEVDQVANYLRVLLDADHPETPLILEAVFQGYFTNLRFREAAGVIDEWRKRAPDDPQAIFLMGRVDYQSSNRQEAAKHWARVLELDPDRDDARLWLAGVCLELGQGLDALPHLELLQRRLPDNIMVQARVGRCLVMLGRQDEATKVLDGVLERQPDLAPALLERGKLAFSTGDLDLAADLLQKACVCDPSERAAYYQLAQCLKRQGKPAAAQLVQDRLQELDRDILRLHEIATDQLSRRPDDPGLHAEVGEIFLRVGAFEQGVRWLHAALQLDPRHAAAHRTLARHYEALGQFNLAEQHKAMTGPATGTPK
jgi:tetratricopeptide (TPR) repeat protein